MRVRLERTRGSYQAPTRRAVQLDISALGPAVPEKSSEVAACDFPSLATCPTCIGDSAHLRPATLSARGFRPLGRNA